MRQPQQYPLMIRSLYSKEESTCHVLHLPFPKLHSLSPLVVLRSTSPFHLHPPGTTSRNLFLLSFAMSHIRAAFDLGSSQHKLTVAEISPHAKPRILHQAAIRVPLADFLSPTNTLPPYILSASHAAVRTLKAAALSFGATHFAAIATHVFRVAHNGPQHLTSLSTSHDMSVTILSSAEEGHLAFSTVSLHVANLSQLVVWDSGGASTQWTHCHRDTFAVHSLPLGSSSVRFAYKRLQCVHKLADWIKAVVTPISDPMLQLKASSGNVVAIGGPSSMFSLAQMRLGTNFFSEDHVRSLFPHFNREEDSETLSTLPKLVLLAELMKLYHISSVRYIPSNGNCFGLLQSKDPRFWGWGETFHGINPTPAETWHPKRQSAQC